MRPVLLFAASLAIVGCRGGNEADRIGVGAECTTTADCPLLECDTEPCPELQCLTQFDGGYCGLADCTGDIDCPFGSACVTHEDGRNYCFRLCDDKPECNLNRSEDVWSNCGSSVVFVEPQTQRACIPSSSGI